LLAEFNLQRVPGFGFGPIPEGDPNLLRTDFPEALRKLRDELGVTRFAMGENFLDALSKKFPEFDAHMQTFIDTAEKANGEAFTPLQVQATRTAYAMKIFGQATAINSGILGANLERLSSAVLNTQNQISAAFAKADQFFRSRREEGRGVQLGIGDPSEFLAGFLETRTEEFKRAQEAGLVGTAITNTIDDLRRAMQEGLEKAALDPDLTSVIVNFLTLDEDLVESALRRAAAAGDEVDVDIFTGNLIQGFVAKMQADPKGFKDTLSTGLADILQEAFAAGNIEKLGFGILDRASPFEQAFDIIAETFPPALRKLRQRLIGDDVDPEILTIIDRALAEIGQGALVANLALKAAFVNIRNPLDDFLKDFFIAEQRILRNVDAANALGLAYDELGERLKNLQQFGQRLFGLDLELLDRTLSNVIQLANAQLVPRTEGQAAVSTVFDQLAQNEQMANFLRENVQGASAVISQVTGTQQVTRLRAEIEVLEGLLATTFGPEGDNALAVFDSFITQLEAKDKDSPATRKLIGFYQDFVKVVEEGRGELAESGAVTEETNTKAAITILLIKAAMEALTRETYRLTDAQTRNLDNLKRQAEFASKRLESEQEIGRAVIDARTNLTTAGLAPLFKETALLSQIIEQRDLEVAIAEKRANLELETLAKRRALSPALGQEQIDAERRAIQSRLLVAREEAQINAERELVLQRIALIEEQQAEFIQIQGDNAQARLEGVRQLLTDIELLTSGAALETFFGVPGQAFVERQADLLMDTLFNTRTGLLKEFSSVVGGSGEIITDAHILGAQIAGPILTQAIITGAEQARVAEALALAPPPPPPRRITGLKEQAELTRIPGFGFAPTPGGLKLDRIPGFGFVPEAESVPVTAAQLARIPGFGFAPTPAEFQFNRIPGFGFAPVPGTPVPDEDEVRKIQLKQLAQAAATIGGNIAGSILGGRGAGAQAGASFGTLAGGIAGAEVLGGVLGTAAGPVGTVVGGVLGGLIGGLFDNEEQQFKALEIIARNTGESVTLLENTNKLLQPQGFTFNLPATFKLPAFSPSNFGGGAGGAGALLPGGTTGSNAVSIQNHISVSVDGTQTSSEIGREIASAVSSELSLQLSSNGLYVPRA
jgi:hypothetical protein